MTGIMLSKGYKNQEVLLPNIKRQPNYHMQYFFTILVGLLFTSTVILLILSLMKFNVHKVKLKRNQNLTKTVSSNFLSIGLDSSLLRNVKKLPIKDPKFINLAKHLSPAYVRIGGTDADCLYFDETSNILTDEKQDSKTNFIDYADISNFTLTSNDFLSLYKFTREANIKIIFDLNTLIRNTDGSWNSNNAEKIIHFAKGHEMELDWQMGNEPNSFLHVFNVSISAEQLAKDYCKLRKLLNESGYQDSILVGPEVNHIGDENGKGVNYAKVFVKNAKNCIDFITWHQYYLNGHIATLKDFTNATVFNRLPSEIEAIEQAINSDKIPMWISETSSAYGGGAPELSDRFVAGFLWIDKLGYSAKAGIQVVIRQTLFGGNYAMVGPDLNPNPDWWVAVIFKRFVSEKVLSLEGPDIFGNVRLYAHCANNITHENESPAIVIYGVNLNPEETLIYIQDLPKKSKIFAFVLTSEHLQSRNIFMNGDLLKLNIDGTLPHFKPKLIDTKNDISLMPYSINFFLISYVEVPECL